MNKKITTTEILPTLSYDYELIIDKPYGNVYLLTEKQTLICELTEEYVTIEDFKEIFSETNAFIEKHQIKKFIFDKQHLRVFHQPSMEWYFLYWKKEIFDLGLKVHRKILPQDNSWYLSQPLKRAERKLRQPTETQ
jgi:hypothetical protein